MTRPKLGSIVIVHWEDAYSRQNWISADDIDRDFNDGEYQCTMVGYLIRDEPDYVIVAARASDKYQTLGLLQRIPRGMVKKIIPLLEKK